MRLYAGDWVITGVQGEKYPCRPDIFAATYEPAEAKDEPGDGQHTACSTDACDCPCDACKPSAEPKPCRICNQVPIHGMCCPEAAGWKPSPEQEKSRTPHGGNSFIVGTEPTPPDQDSREDR
jgi:hypothetical protein